MLFNRPTVLPPPTFKQALGVFTYVIPPGGFRQINSYFKYFLLYSNNIATMPNIMVEDQASTPIPSGVSIQLTNTDGTLTHIQIENPDTVNTMTIQIIISNFVIATAQETNSAAILSSLQSTNKFTYQKQYDYDVNNNCIYEAFAVRGIATTDTGWTIIKYTYDVNNNCTQSQIGTGKWSDRTTITYS